MIEVVGKQLRLDDVPKNSSIKLTSIVSYYKVPNEMTVNGLIVKSKVNSCEEVDVFLSANMASPILWVLNA